MSTVAWHLEYSVEAEVSASFAWSRAIRRWIQRKDLIPDREPLRRRIREVRSGELAAIEMKLDRASPSFEWRFEPLSARRTRLTQRLRCRAMTPRHMPDRFKRDSEPSSARNEENRNGNGSV